MLDSFRSNMRGTALVIVVIIGAVFVFSGTGSLFLSGPGSEVAVVINGENVSTLRVQQVMATEKQRILGENQGLDPALLDDELLKPGVIQRIIASTALAQSAAEQGFVISAKQVSELLIAAEGFQVDGRFDQRTFEYAVRQQGYTSASFVNMVKKDLVIQQLIEAINSTNFVTEAEIASLAKFTQQTRDYYYLTLPVQPIADTVSISAQQVGEYYEQNKAQYQTEIAVSVEAIELSPASLVGSQTVTEDQIQARFDQESEGADLTEQLQAAHIFLSDASDEKLQAIQARLDAGDDFAALAAEYSEDFVSAEVGGDLGFTNGDTFPEAFEAALAKLEQGQVSAPVQTETGTHFIKLLNRQQQTFELASERGRIERELLNEAATDLLVEKLEMLKELSYSSKTLAAVATDLGLELQITEPFSRQGGVGIAAYPAVIKAAFSAQVMEEQYASDVMELGDDRHVVIKLKESFPARQKELSEVRSSVVAALEATTIRQRIAEQGAALLAKVEAGDSVESVAKAKGLDWQVANGVKRISNTVNAEVRDNVFQMSIPAGRAQHTSFYAANGDYVLASLTNVTVGDISNLSAAERTSLVEAVQTAKGRHDVQAYQQSLLANADVVQ